MTADARDAHRHLRDSSFSTPLPPPPPMIPLVEMVRLIEAVRADTEQCPTCDGAIEVEKKRRCYVCTETKPIRAFSLDRNKVHGYSYRCKACHRALSVEARQDAKRKLFREILGKAS